MQKYGGTSVRDIDRIRNVANRAIEYKMKGNDMVIVVSAMSGETDRLLNLAHQTAKFPQLPRWIVLNHPRPGSKSPDSFVLYLECAQRSIGLGIQA